MSEKNPWAVVRYEEGKAVDAIRKATGDGIWSSHELAEVYNKLAIVREHAEGVWGVVQLHRGAETNLMLEIGV